MKNINSPKVLNVHEINQSKGSYSIYFIATKSNDIDLFQAVIDEDIFFINHEETVWMFTYVDKKYI